jgi:hypothetical protein
VALRFLCVPFLTQEYSAAEFSTSYNHLHNAKTFGKPLLVTRNIELEMALNGWAWVQERYEPDERYFRSVEVMLKIMDRRAQYLGLDASDKQEIGGVGGGPVEIRIGKEFSGV